MLQRRRGGVLLHISSLSNNYNIGSIGNEAYKFIDFLKDSGMSYWQFLPLNAIYRDPSPYASISSKGSNMYLIGIDKLIEYGLLPNEKVTIINKDNRVDYKKVMPYKKLILKKAFENLITYKDTHTKNLYDEFMKYNEENAYWLDDYSLFIAIKEFIVYKRKRDRRENDLEEYYAYFEKYKNKIYENKITKHFFDGDMFTWPEELKFRDSKTIERYKKLLHKDILFFKFTQYIFDKEWDELHDYAREKGIKLIGDIPIFINHDSVDVWVHPELFYLDEDLVPTKISGVPPDYFSRTGQLWHNPLYKWDEHKANNYKWWKERFQLLFNKVDVIRIDHFRAFEKFWAVPYGEITATKGKWMDGPKSDFFKTLFEKDRLPIIAEDLGLITKQVTKLRQEFFLPGMFVTQFHMLNYKNLEMLNNNTDSNTVIYTGTHDNETLKGWIDGLTKREKVKLASFLKINPKDLSVYDIIKLSSNTKFNTFIVPMQDILELGNEARMNLPGTDENDWAFRLSYDSLSKEASDKIKKVLEETNRLPDSKVITEFVHRRQK